MDRQGEEGGVSWSRRTRSGWGRAGCTDTPCEASLECVLLQPGSVGVTVNKSERSRLECGGKASV